MCMSVWDLLWSSGGCCTLVGGLFDGDLDVDRYKHGQLANWKTHLCLNADWLQVQQGECSCLLSQFSFGSGISFVPVCKEKHNGC